jgi:hypothetical protein
MSDEKTKAIFARAIEEAKKLKKSKKDQDLTCGKVVCSFKKKPSK